MKKRSIILCAVALVCLVGVAVRIWYVNKDRDPLPSKIFSMGETVSLDTDFFYSADSSQQGYEIQVQSAKVKTIQEFLEEQGETMDFFQDSLNVPISYVYDVEVLIRNNNTPEEENQGYEKYIDLINTQLITNNKLYQIDTDLLYLLYPQLNNASFGFKVLPGTETTVHFPCTVLSYPYEHVTMDKIKNTPTYLLLSMYPTEKKVLIKPE